MIDRKYARKVVLAFAVLPFFPKEPEALTELINAVERFAESEPHADTIKEELIYGEHCPTPGEIRSCALATKPKDEDFHHEPPSEAEREEISRWADEVSRKLSAGVKSL